MFALLASLFFVAATGAPTPAAPSPAVISDTEVVRYLKPVELSEWGSAKRVFDQGQARAQQGESILKLPRAPLAPGAIGETPEQAKARAQKIIDEGKAQMQKALPSLTRLRQVATARYQELNKTVNQQAEIPQGLWSYAIAHSSVRLQKKCRDEGFKEVHLIGASVVSAEGKFGRSKVIADEVREAWEKADAKSLAPVPSDGYTYIAPANGEGTPFFAKSIKVPAAPKQIALVWAELYQLDGANALLFIRMADAFHFRLIGSEAYLTTVGPADALPRNYVAAVELIDQRSFLSRLAASGDWVMSFDRDDAPLGVALIRHLCVAGGQVGVGASTSVAAIIGGDAPTIDGARAWFHLVPEKAQGLAHVYRVSSSTAGSSPVEVGPLTLQIEVKSDKSASGTKPAGK